MGALSREQSAELPSLHQLADLEPLSTGDLIDRAVYIYRHNFASLFGLAAIPFVTSCTGTLLIAYTFTGLRESAATLPVLVLGAILGYSLTYLFSPLLLMLITGGLTRTVADFVMLDVPITFWNTWRVIGGRLWVLILAQLIGFVRFGLLVLALLFIWILVGGALLAISFFLISYLPTVFAGGALILLLLVFLALGFVGYSFAVAQIALIPSVVMIEGRTTGDSIIRARQLARKTTWRIAQITLFDLAMASSAISAIGIPFLLYVILNGDFEDLTRTPAWFILAFNVTDQLGKLLTLPLATISYCLLYFDMRVRQEGYDVALLGARLESTGGPASRQIADVVLPVMPLLQTDTAQTKTAAMPS
ncbi:MAG: hypothetical protein ACUVR8_00590 [Acidobacteriota bacterium]